MESWAIYIDIEGFSKLWDRSHVEAFESLNNLMTGIYRIGCKCYSKFPKCLCAHQAGDGFVVVSATIGEPLERPSNIAIALLRHVASTGYFAKAAITEGDFADIQGCYPREVTECDVPSISLEVISADNEKEHNDHGIVSMGDGLMQIWTVMGTALIRAMKVAKSLPGPLLLVHKSLVSRLPQGLDVTVMEGSEVASLDWVRYRSERLECLQKNASLEAPTEAALRKILVQYCKDYSPPREWVLNAYKYLLHAPPHGT